MHTHTCINNPIYIHMYIYIFTHIHTYITHADVPLKPLQRDTTPYISIHTE